MAKIAILGDTHWGVRNDSLEFLNYFDRFFEEQFFPELKKRGVTHIIQLGDIVDRRKYISYVTLDRLRAHFLKAKQEGILKYDVIIGNHDTPYRNSNDINSMRELFTNVEGLEDYARYYADPTEVEIDGCNILMLPWINAGNVEDSKRLITDTKAQVVMGHLEIKGFEMYRGLPPSHDGIDPSDFDKFELVLSGHYHHNSRRGNILYDGTPYEMTWSDWDDPRGFHIFDTNTRDIEFVRNPMRMFYKLWYDDSKDDLIEKSVENLDFAYLKNTYVKLITIAKSDPYYFDMYLGKLYAAGPIDVNIVEDHRNMDQLSDDDLNNDAEDTLTILNKYIDNLEVGVDKVQLATVLRSLYNEAINMDTDV